jgi:hypothetical protein
LHGRDSTVELVTGNLFNVFDSLISGGDKVSAFNIFDSRVTGGVNNNLFLNNILNSTIDSCRDCNISHLANSSNIKEVSESIISHGNSNKISGIDSSRIMGGVNGLSGAHKFLDIFGNTNRVTGSIVSGLRIFGFNNLFSGANPSEVGKNYEIFGSANSIIHDRNSLGLSSLYGNTNRISGVIFSQIRGSLNRVSGSDKVNILGERNHGDATENLCIFGDRNNVTGCTGLFINGSNNDITGNDNVILGSDNAATGDNILLFGSRAVSNFDGGSVINDGRLSSAHSSQAKGENSLFLDFASGTHLNVPNGSGITASDGKIGSIMYSGNFLLIKTGVASNPSSINWGKVEILPL